MSVVKLEEAKSQIQSMLKRGFIGPSDSPHSAPALFVHPKDGSFWCYIDTIG